MTMKDEAILEMAHQVAHKHSAACRNRAFQKGHSTACQQLAVDIARAMREARDASTRDDGRNG